jgi:16S rRNA G966 N2-methylase RsmD
MKNHVLMLSIFYFFLSCEQKPQQSKQLINGLTVEKKLFLERININNEPQNIDFLLDSAKIDLIDLVLFCRQSKNEAHQIGLIQAVCAGMQNNLETRNEEYWAGILYDLTRFCENVQILKTDKQKVFMDVGAGNGEKLFTALCLGFEQAVGIEYSADLVPIATQNLNALVKSQQIQIIHQDAFQVLPQTYANADFIYLYSPIKDNQTMAKLTYQILQQMKNGTVLLEVRFVYGEELAQLSAWEIPNMAGLFAIKKQENEFYYADYDHHQTKWIKIRPKNE